MFTRHVAPRPGVLRVDSTALDLRAWETCLIMFVKETSCETTEMRLPRASMF